MTKPARKHPIAEQFIEKKRVMCLSCEQLGAELQQSCKSKLRKNSHQRCPECGSWMKFPVQRSDGGA